MCSAKDLEMNSTLLTRGTATPHQYRVIKTYADNEHNDITYTRSNHIPRIFKD